MAPCTVFSTEFRGTATSDPTTAADCGIVYSAPLSRKRKDPAVAPPSASMLRTASPVVLWPQQSRW
jgi:hypothetical protein